MTRQTEEAAVPATMLAALPDDDGRLRPRKLPVPEAGPGEVLVRVHAAGVNRADTLHARGRYTQASRPAGAPNVAGMELAGEVVAAGGPVEGALLGSRVMAMHPGSYAEYAVVDARLLLPVPDALPIVDAAALPMGLMTGFDALVALAGATPGETCVVTGATSGVGLVGVQLAMLLGLDVIATTRSAASVPVLEALGVRHIATSAEEAAALRPDGIDIVLDHVGGDLLAGLLNSLASGARVVSVGRLGGGSVAVELNAFAGRRACLIGTTWRTRGVDEIAAVAQRLAAYGGGLEVRPVLAVVVPFDRIDGLLEVIEAPHAPGKLVVSLLDEGSN